MDVLFVLISFSVLPSRLYPHSFTKELAAIIIVPKILSAENIDRIQKIGTDGVDIVKLATEYTKSVLENKTKGEQK